MDKFRKFDKRTIEMLMRMGELTEKEYQEYLRHLPDLKDEYDETKIEDILPPWLIEDSSNNAKDKG